MKDEKFENKKYENNFGVDENAFFKQNDARINRVAYKTLFFLIIVFPIMGIFSVTGLFEVTISELITVAVIVILLAISLAVFSYFKVNSSIQKYYTVLVIAVIIFLMGQNANIGIYITYVIPIAFSCLYFDPALTVFTVVVDYFVMIGAMALRAPEASVKFNASSAEAWFYAYSMGLTIEYIAMSAVFIIISRTSRHHMRSEQQLLRGLREEEQRYRLALEGSPDVIIEYDVIKDFAMIYGSMSDAKVSKLTPNVVGQFKPYMREMMKEYPGEFAKLDDLTEDRIDTPLELRIPMKDEPGAVRWIILEGNKLYEKDRLVKIIGKLRDITQKKREEEELLLSSRRDRLTKLISKSFGKPLVEEYLFSRPRGEMAVIGAVTIANFDRITDEYGNAFSSTVIEQAAQMLKSKIGEDDIIYRLEDINFLVLLKNTDEKRAEAIFHSMCDGSHEVYSGENKELRVIFDVGFVTTRVSSHYQVLLMCALKALRSAYEIADSTCLQYNESMRGNSQDVNTLGEGYDEENMISDDDEDMVSRCFRILEQTKELKSAINLLLTQIAKEYGLCAVSVVKTDLERRCNIYVYRWSTKSGRELLGEQSFTEAEFAEYVSGFGADGLCENNSAYFEYIDEKLRANLEQNMPSQLRCAIYEAGSLRGAMLFEKSDPAYVWEDKEKSELREIARIMSTHVVKTL